MANSGNSGPMQGLLGRGPHQLVSELRDPLLESSREGSSSYGESGGTTTERGRTSSVEDRILSIEDTMGTLSARYPSINFSGRIVYCRTAPEVESATAELLERMKEEEGKLSRMPLGFDIEWRPTFKRGEVPRKAAVMQICADVANCYVMHIVHSGIPPALKSLLEDSSTVKVGVGIANDATKISRDYNVRVEPLEELSGYANLKLGGAPKRWSLSSLTESLTCKQLEKPGKIRMGNWEVDVLSKEQLHYAATDAFVSWYLHQILMTFPDAKCNDENAGEVNDAVS